MSEPTTPRPESAQLACPECGTLITYYDVEGSEYYACPSCHAYFKYSGEETPKVFGNYKQVAHELPIIPLGALGKVAGSLWRVLGFVVRCEFQAQQYSWTEYQLYDASTGAYAQLAQYRGHWMLARPAPATHDYQAKPNGDFVFTKEANFKIYNRYQARIVWAVGEFDWDIEGDDDLTITEFIAPPVMLVREKRKDSDQLTWYRAEHLEPAEVATAFGLDPAVMPAREGVGALQPDPIDAKGGAMRTLTVLAIGLLFIGQLLSSMLHPTQKLLSENLQVQADSAAAPGTGRVIVSTSFTLPQQAALDIDLTATLSNQWLELPVSLVNEQTGQGFEFTKNIEFYSGVERGETWREGSRDASALLTKIPAGRYHLNFYPFTEANSAPPEIVVRVTANPTLFSNFLIALLLVLIYPGVQLWRSIEHESRRWSASDFNPNT